MPSASHSTVSNIIIKDEQNSIVYNHSSFIALRIVVAYKTSVKGLFETFQVVSWTYKTYKC